ncbi:MAG: DUF4013 domain-containing protein, partial [Vicinamibacteria bacterium]
RARSEGSEPSEERGEHSRMPMETVAQERTVSVSSPADFDVTRAFTFFFQDRNWIPKLAIGTLFVFLTPFIIGAIVTAGYAVSLARRTRENQDPLLPEWDDLQEIFFDGLRGLAVSLAHKLPLILLGALMALALVGGVFLGRAEGTVPEEFMFLGLPALFGGSVVVLVLALAVLVYVPAAMVRLVQTDRVVAAFDVMANVDFIRSILPTYALGVLAIVLSSFIAQLGFLVFCVGIFPASFWSVCVMGYVIGELAKLPEGRPGGREIAG